MASTTRKEQSIPFDRLQLPRNGVHLLVDPDDREAVYRFRYSIYIREMQRHQQYADHHRHVIKEPLDDSALLFAAFRHGQLTGTVRVNLIRFTDVGHYYDLYRLSDVSAAHVSISTKFMVASGLRGSSTAVKLALAAYRYGLADGFVYDYMDCNFERVAMFEKLGYRKMHTAEHPEYGPVQVMRVALRDHHHLRAVQSPFVREYEAAVHRQMIQLTRSDSK